ncbi:23S rRNA (pseudouridine(1915)-N(3))-methyltransferase RlmH, partial [Salmonella enterica]|uniref:23S rRNA (pseudouridine(1915)-N(3))-methyltransferase RlmH n=1 Tax=Salmonella enterica TaxID=28901 RepID=UPI003CF716E1
MFLHNMWICVVDMWINLVDIMFVKWGSLVNIYIIAVGKLKEKYLKQGIEEYMKRLSTYAKMDIIEVA